MGLIKDIVDKVAPKVQERISTEGIGINDALYDELKKLGYLPKRKHNRNIEKDKK